MSLKKTFLVLLLIINEQRVACLSDDHVLVKEGQSLTLRCTYFSITSWHVTVNDYIATARNSVNGQYSSYLYDRKVSYLQILKLPPNVTKIECSTFTWSNTEYETVKPISLQPRDVSGFLQVKLGSHVTFHCSTESVPYHPIMLYKNDEFITSTITSQVLMYTATVENTDSFLIRCAMNNFTDTVLVTVKPCQIEFNANSQSGELDVDPGNLVEFVCTTEASCESEMSLIIENTGEVFNRSDSLDTINYIMKSLNCGTSFYVGCRLAEDKLTQNDILVRIASCPKLNILVNNMAGDEIDSCSDSDVFVSCSYQGLSLSKTLQLYWRGQYNDRTDLNISMSNSVTYTLSDQFLKNVVYDYTDYWIGCSMQSVTDSTVEIKVTRKQCLETVETSETRMKPVNSVIIGVSVGAAALVILILYCIVIYCKRTRHSPRMRERNRSTLHPPSMHLVTSYMFEPPRMNTITRSGLEASSGLFPEFTTLPSVQPPEYTTLPPSYEDVVNFYKNNNQGDIECKPGET